MSNSVLQPFQMPLKILLEVKQDNARFFKIRQDLVKFQQEGRAERLPGVTYIYIFSMHQSNHPQAIADSCDQIPSIQVVSHSLGVVKKKDAKDQLTTGLSKTKPKSFLLNFIKVFNFSLNTYWY